MANFRGREVSVADLQDAVHYAIASVGGIDAHGRESTFAQREVSRHPRGGHGRRKITSAEWRHRARVALRRSGLPVSSKLKGEQLIKYIDRLAHAIGWDAFHAKRFTSFDPDVYGPDYPARLPHRKVSRRHQARRAHS